LYADSTADAGLVIDVMHLTPLTADGVHRAVSCANGTACAGWRLYFKTDQRTANLCRTALFINMRFIFFAKMLERADDRVWRTLPKSAETVARNFMTQVFKFFNIAFFALSIANFL